MKRRQFLSCAAAYASTCRTRVQASIVEASGIQELISSAYRERKPNVLIPPGVYRLEKGHLDAAHLSLRNMHRFAVDAEGVTFVLTDIEQGGIEITNCTEVTISGATFQFETPPSSQAVIQETAADGRWARITVEDGYPANLDDNHYFPPHLEGYLFDPKTRVWKPRADDFHTLPPERLGARDFRLTWGRPALSPQFPIAKGDLIAFRGRPYHANVTIRNCERIRLENITVHNSTAFGVLETDGDGNNLYTNLRVIPGGKPPGASTNPLLSSCADGLHSSNMRHGPTIQNCVFEGMGDDAIAIHGTFSTVLQAQGTSLVINKSSFRPGDPLLMFDKDGVPRGEAVVARVSPAPGFTTSRHRTNKTLGDNTLGPYTSITLDRPLAADFEYLCCTPAALGSGYVVRNNVIRNHRSRGLMLKAHDGLVEGNAIEGSTMAGIVLAPEIWWNEAGYSRNVTIRNNTITRVADYVWPSGAIRVMAINDVNNDCPVAGQGHKNITIDNNTISHVNGSNILITSADTVSVTNNRFQSPQTRLTNPVKRKWLADPASLIYVANAKNVVVEENRVEQVGTANKELLEVESNVTIRSKDLKPTVRPDARQ